MLPVLMSDMTPRPSVPGQPFGTESLPLPPPVIVWLVAVQQSRRRSALHPTPPLKHGMGDTVRMMDYDREEVLTDLDEKAVELRAKLAELTAPVDADAVIGFGKRIGDGTTQAIQQMGDASIAQNLAGTLEQVERAREKATEGSWGRCDTCDETIPEGRLSLRPWSTTCVEHAD